jgi:hypothetical protein
MSRSPREPATRQSGLLNVEINMNRKTLIRMATDAGLVYQLRGKNWIDAHEAGQELVAFAARVASYERDACAKRCQLTSTSRLSPSDDRHERPE